MKNTTENRGGRAALMVAHCAGMVDLVALPVWVGVLISGYGLDQQQAGGLATLFLIGAVSASLFIAPRSSRLPPRATVTVGYAIASLAFVLSDLSTITRRWLCCT
jgi:MFS family permease